MVKVALLVVIYFGHSQSSVKFEMPSLEHCETQAEFVKQSLKADGYSVSTVCVVQ